MIKTQKPGRLEVFIVRFGLTWIAPLRWIVGGHWHECQFVQFKWVKGDCEPHFREWCKRHGVGGAWADRRMAMHNGYHQRDW